MVGPNRDVIYDFDDLDLGDDRIDLTLVAGVTDFVAQAQFTAPGQVRVQQAGSSVLVQINTAGNDTAEAEILIANATIGTGVGQVDGGDFLL